MWSDNDIDNAFRRLDPTEPDPTPFPLDAWLKLESGLDQAVIDRAVRRRLWQFFAAEVAVVALVGLGWSLWPAGTLVSAGSKAQPTASMTAPLSKAAGSKQLRNAAVSEATSPTAPANRSAVGNPTAEIPRPATTPAATAPIVAAVSDAAIATASPTRQSSGRELRLPLAVALAPGRQLASATRAKLTDGRATTSGNGVAGFARPTIRSSENTSPAPAAGQKAAVRSRAVAASAVEAEARIKTLARLKNHPSRKERGLFANGRMAAPSRAAASGVAVADAASHSGGVADATPAGSYSTTGAKSLATSAGPDAAGATIIAGTQTDPLNPIAAGSLDPMVASVTASERPATAPIPTQLAPAEFIPNPLPAVVRQPRFFVGIVAAPDVSTVRFAGVEAPHLNVGLTLEYRLGQRWRVATGVQRATKEYYARREDYDWTDYPKAQTRDFSWVEGQCTVIDLPLNLRYDAVIQAHTRWFGTVGLSSFLMHRENYSYDYLEGGTYNNWNLPGLVNTNQHFFSVLNLSAGYEYGLGAHWRLQAEPYVKAPLAGVGAGKVKLLSAGVYFGVKYGF